MGETLFCYRVSGGDFISVKGRLCFGGRLYSVTPTGLTPFCLEFTSRIITDRLIRYVHRDGYNQSINQSINRLIKKIPADTAATRITIANQRLFQLHTE